MAEVHYFAPNPSVAKNFDLEPLRLEGDTGFRALYDYIDDKVGLFELEEANEGDDFMNINATPNSEPSSKRNGQVIIPVGKYKHIKNGDPDIPPEWFLEATGRLASVEEKTVAPEKYAGEKIIFAPSPFGEKATGLKSAAVMGIDDLFGLVLDKGEVSIRDLEALAKAFNTNSQGKDAKVLYSVPLEIETDTKQKLNIGIAHRGW